MTTSARERAIRFTGEMVRAIQAGRKTQTRRPVKWPDWATPERHGPLLANALSEGKSGIAYWEEGRPQKFLWPPFGLPGHGLWVKETWWQCEAYGGGIGVPFAAYDAEQVHRDGWLKGEHRPFPPNAKKGRWGKRPSIHMSRWASRINLLVKRVWVERVQDISEVGAMDEGMLGLSKGALASLFPEWSTAWEAWRIGGEIGRPPLGPKARERFLAIWDSIYKAKGYGWEANPWVFCCEFEQLINGGRK